jgi:hypothetical protein
VDSTGNLIRLPMRRATGNMNHRLTIGLLPRRPTRTAQLGDRATSFSDYQAALDLDPTLAAASAGLKGSKRCRLA